MSRHKVYTSIINAVKKGKLREPFSSKEFKEACSGFGEGTYKTFLHKHSVGNPGKNTELVKRISAGQFILIRPLKYGLS